MGQFNLVVVGGNNVDINATACTQLVYGDSNPGRIHTGLGGVGRNIAENLVRLGQHVKLITAFGEDEFSELARVQAERLGMDITDSVCIPGAPSSIYVCINEPGGEMSVAVNDMDICNHITPEYLAQRLTMLNAAHGIVLEANIPQDSIDYLVQHCTAPIFADAVSAKKASRLHRSLPHLKALKANQIEVELLTGLTITHEHDMSAAAHALHQMGVEYVLITLGARGAFASDGNTQVFDRPFPQRMVNTTGCGDAFTAATTVALLEGRSVHEVLRMGLAAAAVCGQSESAVSEQITYDALRELLAKVQTQEATKA